MVGGRRIGRVEKSLDWQQSATRSSTYTHGRPVLKLNKSVC